MRKAFVISLGVFVLGLMIGAAAAVLGQVPATRTFNMQTDPAGRVLSTTLALLFSYGTLQLQSVQLSTFGRRLDGNPDELRGFEQAFVKIGDTHQKNVTFNGNDDARVPGMVFEVTDAELVSVDSYEAAFSYRRMLVTLASGRQAWVYVYARNAC